MARITTRQIIRACGFGLLTIAATSSYAQDADPRRGLVVAQDICAASPNAAAPTFQTIAAVPGMTAIALQASLQTSHTSMPNLILQAEDRANVVAYIMSLKSN